MTPASSGMVADLAALATLAPIDLNRCEMIMSERLREREREIESGRERERERERGRQRESGRDRERQRDFLDE